MGHSRQSFWCLMTCGFVARWVIACIQTCLWHCSYIRGENGDTVWERDPQRDAEDHGQYILLCGSCMQSSARFPFRKRQTDISQPDFVFGKQTPQLALAIGIGYSCVKSALMFFLYSTREVLLSTLRENAGRFWEKKRDVSTVGLLKLHVGYVGRCLKYHHYHQGLVPSSAGIDVGA